MTSEADVDAFLTWMAVEKGRARNTLAAYRRDLGRYLTWLGEHGIAVRDATNEDVEGHVEWLRAQGLAPASVIRAVTVVRGLHRFLSAEERTDHDPTLRLETPRRPQSLPKALTEEQIERLFAAVAQADGPVGLRDSALLEVLYGSGLRISEAVGLSMGDIDLDGRLLRAFGMVPRGTHHWDDFATPDELADLLAAVGLTMGEPRGIAWSPTKGLHLSDDMALNFIVTARRD